MAQIALPRHQATQSQSNIGAPLYQRRQHANAGPIELIPNPEFSFPMRAPDTASSEPAPANGRPMSLQAYPQGRRGSMPHRRQKSINALPDFSFNPAGAAKPAKEPSPPQSPATLALPVTPTKTTHGHRRGGSEFIGGDVRPGGTAPMSSSPTKGDDVLPVPSATLRPGPPAGRRGHAHRRSGAISSHDLTTIMQPPVPGPTPSRTGSAPSTPSEGKPFPLGHKFNRSISQPSLRENPSDEDGARPPSRARVTFSDRIETIRPLSTISSETEATMSLRGHSAANSLSSIVGCGSPQPARSGRPCPSLHTVEDEDSRPSTAGAVLDMFVSGRMNGDTSDRKRPVSALSPVSPTTPTPKLPSKRRSLFHKDSRRDSSAHPTLPTSASDPALSKSFDSPLTSPMAVDEPAAEAIEKPKSVARKMGRKPRKVKSWANSIITRKGKHSKRVKARSPTPPPMATFNADESDDSEMDFEPNFDEDTTVTIVSPTEDSTPRIKIDTNYASWQPRALTRVDSDIMSPVIDLDAALGPFNTPNGTSPRDRQRGFSAHRRAMHSASGIAPSHRRTESAPELVPFEHRSSAIANASPMDDVFEEEEPEDDLTMVFPTKETKSDSVVVGTPEPKIAVVEAEVKQHGPAINWNFNDGLCIKRNLKTADSESSEPVSPRALPVQQLPEPEPIEVVEDYEEPRTSSLTHSSDSTVTPHGGEDSPKPHEPVMNLSLPLHQQNIMTPDTVASSFSSPDYRSSQISFDTARGGTAASSITDYPVMPSPRFGEPGPEVRISTEVPSLTSSRSTMTSAMLQNAYPLASPRRIGDRTSSLSSDPSEIESRRRKRSSIASLSRLMGTSSSSFSERSKLSIEQRPQSEHREAPKEKKKKNIGSRLRKFFQNTTRDSSPARNPK
ncbi:hypothetical protein PtrSN002B_007793 [Pyrenophora tritici-repentis]|uniref:Atrophin-1 multi-domain protein n=2 Tax=Pyrenophora tritici-repentis TaxID=45151 RepID=A0A2W1D232_9PLEO|nr:uncharacterized protein PTRG_09810 [Pyrenophora tritici-repentis Pt-1C-BFP]KAA8621814.1 hypothetical protein PtrV1_06315 [Pyrenophora tritici-repentis]EDU42861.1 conserved hypothetical protein [Pyrenophora tritici-repentis Pt-1C-BFP]KAF7451035.1 hypothetical protein A1F99_056510 [Pyrenophora tritici-repentis]KAF7573714.1 Atrophin-1 multi-domain protein [Pyrenophora tritici-repentis]KAG9380751.1 hypothetical protein A1F94_008071 [Pyrenophora tritici-repentis]